MKLKKQIITTTLLIFTYLVFAQKKPNIVLLFVDDYGWSDVGYRNPVFDTPNINQLKKDGLDFSRAYIATPTCSPSRGSLLTGKEPIRFQMPRHITGGTKGDPENPDGTINEFNLWPKDPVQMPSRNWLPLEEITYAERLKEYGYYNMLIGKWHLGYEPYRPTMQGFDDYYGDYNAGHPRSYYPKYFNDENNVTEYKDGDYLTDVLTNKAEDFIKNYDKQKPFMLSFWYYNVHSPHIGRKDLVEKYKKQGLEGKYAEYAAMVTSVDESVGSIRKALDDKGIADNTIVILLSDQGGFFSNTPLSGGKIGGNTLGEGGARVPFIFYYPSVTKSNTVTDIPVQSLDLYPTFIEIASGKKCTDNWIQGKSLMPIIKGGTIKKRNLYFFRSYEDQYAAIMNGDWKLIKYHSGKYQLFNIAKDISEQHNLVDSKPKIFDKMKKDLKAWEEKVVKK